MAEANTTEKPRLTLVRRFDAPVEALWRAWTEPQALKRWFGPDAGEVSLAQADVRVGGRFHVVFKTLDGEQHDVSGTYREVQANRKLFHLGVDQHPRTGITSHPYLRAEGEGHRVHPAARALLRPGRARRA